MIFLLLLSSGLSSYTTIERLESLFSPFGSVSEGTHLLLNHRFQIQFPFLTMEIFNVCSSASSWSKNPEAQRVWFCHISIPGWSKEGSSSHEWSGMCPPLLTHITCSTKCLTDVLFPIYICRIWNMVLFEFVYYWEFISIGFC